MAKVKLGALAGQISGSVGTWTFAHNRGGAYLRLRSMPVTHTGTRPTSIKALMSFFSQSWNSLNADARSAWTEFARQHPVIDSLGESRPLTGHQSYVGLSTKCAVMGVAPSSNPPTVVTPLPLASLSLAAVSAGAITATFTVSPTPATTSLWVEAMLTNSKGRNYVKPNLRYCTVYAAAVTSPKVITTQFVALCGAITAGQICHVQISVVHTASGLTSVPLRASAIAS